MLEGSIGGTSAQRARKVIQLVEFTVGVVLLVVVAAGCGSDDGSDRRATPTVPAATATPTATPVPLPMIAVLGAFPGEMAPVLERAVVERTEMIAGKRFRIGTLSGVPVVIGITGIGLVNAANTTRALLERFDVEGVVVSAVAGSPYRIGDVVVPETWFEDGTPSVAVDPVWLTLAEELTAPGAVAFDSCTAVPTHSNEPVCLLQDAALIVGGIGHSSDPYGGVAFPCMPRGNEVFGCDIRDDTGTAMTVFREADGAAGLDEEIPVAEDMETSAVAIEAAAKGVRFIAFRGVSDGEGDPLNLPGFPTQFFAYYPLAANNAAAAAAAFLDRVAETYR